MHQRIGGFNVLLLEGTLNKDNLEAIINKANDLFEGSQGFMQCCSLEFVPSLEFALNAAENALLGKPLGSVKMKKPALAFLLWLYCTTQLEKAIELAGKKSKGVLLVAAAKDKELIGSALEEANKLGFVEEAGLAGKNTKALIEHFGISENELRAFSHLPKEKAIEALALERQALLSI